MEKQVLVRVFVLDYAEVAARLLIVVGQHGTV